MSAPLLLIGAGAAAVAVHATRYRQVPAGHRAAWLRLGWAVFLGVLLVVLVGLLGFAPKIRRGRR